MQVDSKMIRSERDKRAWTQQHLAQASGLALRTIQRIESTENASYESATAIASCFELAISELRIETQEKNIFQRRAKPWKLASFMLGLIVVAWIFLVRSVYAEQLLLDIVIEQFESTSEVSGTRTIATKILVEEGEEVELPQVIDQFEEGSLKFGFEVSIKNNIEAWVSIKVYESRNGEYVLIAEPAVKSTVGKGVEIRLGPDENSLRITVIPSIYEKNSE